MVSSFFHRILEEILTYSPLIVYLVNGPGLEVQSEYILTELPYIKRETNINLIVGKWTGKLSK